MSSKIGSLRVKPAQSQALHSAQKDTMVTENSPDRERAIDLAITQIEKQFGKGAIMRLGEEALIRDIPVISTGSIGLDLAPGVGGPLLSGSSRGINPCDSKG